MFRKMMAAILAIALIATMWMIPSKASNFSDVPFFNADFSSGSFNDIAGGVTGEESYYGEAQRAEFVQDETIGRQVLRFHQDSALFYTGFDYTKIQSNFTMEAYVNVPSRQSGWGYIAGSYWNNNPNAGICFTYGAHTNAGIGSNMRYNVIEGNGKTSQTTQGARLAGGWMHLVYVHDGVNEYYYENGQLVSSQAVWCQNIPSVTDDSNKAFRIGGYNRVSQFCANMDCAYVRVYSSAAASTDVEALYTNRNNDAPTPGAPTEAPSPTAVPTGKLFEVDFSTGSGADTTGNYTITQSDFDDNCVIEQDETIGTNVAVFDGWGGINYTTDKNLYNYDLTKGITLEAYVNLNDVQHNMAFIETSGSALHLQQYNDGKDLNVGFRCGDWTNGAYNMQNAYTANGTILPSGKWVHLVGTSDGLTNRFYIDGELIASVQREQSLLKTPAGNEANTKLTVGESVFGGMWGATMMEGKIAFARIYSNAVNDTEAAELYYTVNPDARPDVTPEPTEEPTPAPTEAPTPVPELKDTLFFSNTTPGVRFADAVNLPKDFSIELYLDASFVGEILNTALYSIEVNEDGTVGSWEFYQGAKFYLKSAATKVGDPIHVVLVGEGNSLSLYVNGVFAGSVADNALIVGNYNWNFGGKAKFGQAGNTGCLNFYGKAATAEEVAELYEPYKPVPKQEASLIFASKPSKLYYEVGDALDLAGMQLVIKVDGVKTPVAIEDCTVTGFDSSVAGLQKITVTYETEDTIYSNLCTIRVIEKTPTVGAIGLATKPAKLRYAYGEALDTTGLSVLVHYSDGTTGYVSEDLEVTGYDANVSGVQRLTVTYEGRTTSFSVKIAERNFDDSIIFDVDFRTGSTTEKVRGIEPSLNGTTFRGFVESSNGQTVADLSTPTMLEYNIPFEVYAAMQDHYTMEAYVNITDGNGANLGQIAGDVGWLADNGVGLWVRNLAGYGSGTELSAQEGKKAALAGGNRNEWNHLVYVHDGDTAYYYVNGVLAGTAAVTTTAHDTTVGFHIGAYSGDGNFAALGQYAFVKVYGAAATATEVAALYAAR